LKIFVEKKMMGKANYPKILEQFSDVNFVDTLEDNFDVEVMIIMNSTLKNINIDKYKNLKWIQLLMAGYDNVDVKAYKEKGVLVSNARDIFSTSIAEDIFSKILFFNRNTKFYLESMKNQVWSPIKKEPEIYGSTISILGTGSIGQEVAKRMKAFGANRILGFKNIHTSVPYFDEIYTGENGLETVIKEADYLIIALPLNDKTYHLIDKQKISWMKENAVLINVARGNIVDQDYLIEALKQKLIRAAGLDVTDPEPLPKTSELWNLDNVFITPHNASSSPYMKQRLYKMVIQNLSLYLANQKPKYLL